MTENEIGKIVVDSAVKVHRHLGPGLLESVYENVLYLELLGRNLEVQCQVPIDINYMEKVIQRAFIADLIVQNRVILELKSVEKIAPIHSKQVITYLKLTGIKLGFVLNFGSPLMKDGIIRLINGKL